MGGLSRLAEKMGMGKGDEAGRAADDKSHQHAAASSGKGDLRHSQDLADAKDAKDVKDSKGGKDEPAQRPPTPPPSYEPGPQRQPQQQAQQWPPQPQQQQGQQGEQWQQPQQQLQNAIPRQFPPAFNLYNAGFSRTFMLGEHEDQPLYAVRLHSGLSSSPPIVLHNGPDPDRCDVLASAEMASFGGDFTLTVPPMPGVQGASAVEVLADIGFTSRCYRFDMEVGQPGTQTRREVFEWRHSYGSAIDALGGDWDGWKLVRMSRGPPPGASGGSPPGQFATSDGFEVVAAWADAVMSMSKSAKFAFVGTGDSGLLGERWAVAAVVSALGIWQKERQRKRRSRN